MEVKARKKSLKSLDWEDLILKNEIGMVLFTGNDETLFILTHALD